MTYEYVGTVLRVIDGDTLHVELDLGCDVRIRLTLRLAGINCPEMGTPEGQAAKDYVVGVMEAAGNRVVVHTVKDKREKYGRYLAHVYVDGPVNLNAALLERGLATVYR